MRPVILAFRAVAYLAFIMLIACNFQWWPKVFGWGDTNAVIIGMTATIIAAQFGRNYIFSK